MDQPSWIGRSLGGRYKIEALLGQGGMSAVYRASDPNLKRVVAVKLIHPHLSTDPSFVSRFEGEASAVASLRHPNIIQVYDFNNDGGTYYMVLEFIPGESLQARLQRLNDTGRLLEIDQALKFAINISEAVGYAHQRGMIHRDIKPANIMLDVHGQAILMDFGIVKIVGGDSHTSTGALVGTARYMPPEVIRGEVADGRSDLYSLGVTMYEMLSGRPPFVADSAMTLMMMQLNDPVPDIRTFRSDVPRGIVSIVEKCLTKNRDARYQSAAELADDLKRALTALEKGEPVQSVATIRIPKDKPPAREAEPASLADPNPAQRTISSIPPSGTQSQSYIQTGATGAERRPTTSSTRWLWLLAAGVLGIFCIFGTVLAGGLLLSRRSAALSPADRTASAQPANVNSPTEIAAVLSTSTPEAASTVTPTVTPTYPPLYVKINSIIVDDSGRYVVDYETFGFTEVLPGQHIHFFFDTVPPDQAGSPGSGPWILYGGPSPFTKYKESDRPADATKMCALVANPNHSVVAGSGNCASLP